VFRHTWTLAVFYLVGSLRVVDCTAPKPRLLLVAVGLDRRQMSVLCLPDLSSAFDTVTTSNCCCNDSCVSLACVAQCSSEFKHTFQTGHLVLCAAICCRLLSTLCGRFRKAQSVRCSSSCTWRTLQTGPSTTAYVSLQSSRL